MKAIEVLGTVDSCGNLALDQPLGVHSQRVRVIVLLDGVDELPDEIEEETKESILEDFRQAWHEAMTGQAIPVSQLWDGIDDE